MGTFVALVGLLGCGTPAAPVEPTPPPEPDNLTRTPVAPSPAEFRFSAAIDGAVPDGARTYVLWLNMSGDPDRVFNFGEAVLEPDARVDVRLVGTSPTDGAINDVRPKIPGRFAVGAIVVMAPGTELPEGELTDLSALEEAMIGFSLRHAIIWREGDFSGGGRLAWPGDFPEGEFSCGQCVDNESAEESYDSFAPIDCNSIVVPIGEPDEGAACNWT